MSMQDYKFLFNYLQLWRSYAILSVTIQFICSERPPSSAEIHAGWSHCIHHINRVNFYTACQHRKHYPAYYYYYCYYYYWAAATHVGSTLAVSYVVWRSTYPLSNVCSTCFYWLRQLRQVRRSHAESVLTLVHAFVTSRVDYCNAVLARAPRYITDKL